MTELGVTELEMAGQGGIRGVAAGVEPLDQRRVSIVCRSTRVDLTLPAHLELVAVVPEIVDLIRDHVRAASGPASGVDVDARMGGAAGGSWQLSRLAGGPLAVSETLAQQRVHDGEILVLDHRPVPTPAPLFDDVLQGLTNPDVARSPAWGRRDAWNTATAASAAMGIAAAAALARQWWTSGGLVVPVVAALVALVSLAAVLALRSAGSSAASPAAAHAVAGACTVVFTVLAAASVGPPPVGPGHLVGAFTAGAVLTAVLRSTVFRPTPGHSYGLAAGYLALGAVLTVAAAGALVAAIAPVPTSAIGAGVLLTGLLVITAAPRVAVSAARVPIPPVPAPGEDVEAGDLEDIDHDVRARDLPPGRTGRGPRGPLPTPDVLRHRFLTSRSWLTGSLAAGGALCTAGSLISLTGGPGTSRWATPLALVLIVVLILRGLGYADRVHTAVLSASAVTLAAGVLLGAGLTLDTPVGVVVPAALALSAAAVVAVAVLPNVDPSPAALRAVGTIEAIGICVIVPLAVGAMEVYTLVRQR